MSTIELRQRLLYLHAYSILRHGLEPGDAGIRNPEIKAGVNELREFCRSATDEEIETRGPRLEELLRQSFERDTFLHLLRRPDEIGQDLIRVDQQQDVIRFGVRYGWLTKQFRQPILGLPMDLPWHARIGLGPHAGSVAIEESTLLDDTFFLLAQTEKAWTTLQDAGKLLSEPKTAKEM